MRFPPSTQFGLPNQSPGTNYEIDPSMMRRLLDWPVHVGYYGLRDGKLAKAPYEKCVELFKKARSQS